MKMPKSKGLMGHPCFTPTTDWKLGDSPSDVLTHTGTLAYMALTACSIAPPTPERCSAVQRNSRFTDYMMTHNEKWYLSGEAQRVLVINVKDRRTRLCQSCC